MTTKPFFIGPIREGLERNLEPFLLPNDAYPYLTDCYLYKGRIERRIGNDQLGRMVQEMRAQDIGPFVATPTTITIPAAVLGIVPGTITVTIATPWTYIDNGTGRLLSVNTFAITAISLGNPAVLTVPGHNVVAGNTVYILDATGMLAINGGPYVVQAAPAPVPGVSFAINVDTTLFPAYTGGGIVTRSYATTTYTNNSIIFYHGIIAAANVYATLTYYTGRPVMGLPNLETSAINKEILIAFDTVKANEFIGGLDRFRDISYYKMPIVAPTVLSNAVAWTGNNYDFFWSLNYYNVLWSTNNIPGKHGYAITGISVAANAVITIPGHTFVAGDVVFINEVTNTMSAINGLIGTVAVAVAGVSITVNISTAGLVYGGQGVCFALSRTVTGDGIRFYDGYGVNLGWRNFSPPLSMGAGATAPLIPDRYLFGGLIFVAYRNRLVVLNTWEGNFAGATYTNYPQRARWCWNGTPFYATASIPAVAPNPHEGSMWLDTTPGLGGYIDAPTDEQIVSCGFYKDTLIVFFERSTWSLVYTRDETLPFVWQRINTQFGAESTFSIVPFDEGLFVVGDKGIVVADSVNVTRIDQKIPDEVYQFHNSNNGPKRVHGIRDFYFQFVYWTFPDVIQDAPTVAIPKTPFPDKTLVLNYLDKAYSFFTDSYTCFGYFQRLYGRTWRVSTKPWNTIGGTWATGRSQADYPSVVAGNQQGFVMITEDSNPNGESLYITAITQAASAAVTSPNHNLKIGQYVSFSAVEGMTQINGLIGKIVIVTDLHNFTVDVNSAGFGAYTRGGLLTVHNNIEIRTKRFNPFFQEGKKARMNYLDLYLENTAKGRFEVDIYGDDSSSQPLQTATIQTSQTYGPGLTTQKMWQRVFADVEGQFLQYRFYLSDFDMKTTAIRNANIVIHGLIPWMMPSGRTQSYDQAYTNTTVYYSAVLVTGAIFYTNVLVKIPVKTSSFILTITNNATHAVLYTFEDNGAGILSDGTGNLGTIIYDVGYFDVNFPALPAGTYDVSVNYDYWF